MRSSDDDAPNSSRRSSSRSSRSSSSNSILAADNITSSSTSGGLGPDIASAEAAPRSVPQGFFVPFCATRVPHYGRSTTRAPPRVPHFGRSTCDTCCHLHDRINATTDMVEKGALHAEKRDHLKKIQASRATYFARREFAQTDPSRYMSLVVDSMDSTATDLHIIGAISHGRRRRAFMFVGSNRFNRRTNVTIEIVHRVLLATLEAEGGLPPVLHLQLTNTENQCKSHFLVGCLSLLVAQGVFEQVTMSYFPVGHAIDEIDQLLSLLAFTEIDY